MLEEWDVVEQISTLLHAHVFTNVLWHVVDQALSTWHRLTPGLIEIIIIDLIHVRLAIYSLIINKKIMLIVPEPDRCLIIISAKERNYCVYIQKAA